MGSRNRFTKRVQAPAKMQAPAQVRSRAENRRSVTAPPSGNAINGNVENAVRVSQPQGEPTVYAGQFADRRGSDKPGSATPASTNAGEGRAMSSAETSRAGAGFPTGVIRPQDYSVNPGGRQSARVSPTGLPQTGTQTSPASTPIDMNRSFEDLLGDMGVSGYNGGGQFTSNNLFTREAGDSDKFNAAAPGITGQSYDNYGAAGGVAAASMQGREEFVPMTGNESRIEGGTDRAATGSLEAALADKEGINSYMSKFSSGEKERMRRRAFLDADTAMDGLKAREALDGYVHAGGKYYAQDGEGKKELKFGDNRKIASGKTTADALLKSYTTNIKETKAESAAERQDPATTFGSGVDIKASNPGAGAFNLEKADFNLNNAEGDGSFQTSIDIGNKGGKKFPTSYSGL